MSDTYVLDNIEVKKTGRLAKKTVGSRSLELVEVTPADEYNGTWKKWVPMNSLFMIQEAGSPNPLLQE